MFTCQKQRADKANSIFSLFTVTLTFIITYGIFIRLCEYLANRSVWLDEASLALNIIHKSFTSMMTAPLDYNQAAPIGFLVFTKIMIFVFGKSEFVLRFIPLISSFISFFVLYQFSLKCVPRRFVLLPLFLFAASAEMVRYATEFKQYSSDVLFALVIALYVTSLIGKKYTLKQGMMFGVLGASVLWFSFPALFMLGGAGIVLFSLFVFEKKWDDLKHFSISLFFWGMSFIFHYFFFLKNIGGNSALDQYWAGSFMPLPPLTLNDQLWFAEKLIKIFYHPGMIHQAFIGLILFMIGSYAMYRNQKILFFVLIVPLALVLLASSIHKYPFEGRVMLFYVPFMYVLIASGCSFLIEKRSYFSRLFGIIFLVLILFPALLRAHAQFSSEVIYREEMKPILNYVRTHKQNGDVMYLYYGADRVFQYYLDSYGFGKESYIKGIESRGDWEKYRQDLDQLKGKKRVWLIFAHVYSAEGNSEERYMVEYLESIGKRLDAFHAVNAAVYLYHFNDPFKKE